MGPRPERRMSRPRGRIGRRRCADATRRPSSHGFLSCTRRPGSPRPRLGPRRRARRAVHRAAQSVPDTLARIRAAKQIDVAYSTDSPPFSFAGEGKRPTGYSIDLCQRVITQIGRAVRRARPPDEQWVSGSVGERLEMVRSGKVQLECGNTSMTLARLSSVDFSMLVFIDGGALLVRDGSPVRKLADLAGRTVGVEAAGRLPEPRLLELLRERSVAAKVERLRDNGEGFAKLGSGAIDALRRRSARTRRPRRARADPRAYEMLPEDLSVRAHRLRSAAQRRGVSPSRSIARWRRSTGAATSSASSSNGSGLTAAPTASSRRSTS